MAIYNDAVQTDAGRALENRARSGEGAIEFTYIKTGSGSYTEEERGGIRGATDLKSPKQRFSFSGINLGDGGDYLSLESVIKNEGVGEGYHLSEVGIFARLAGEEESVMYCISLVDEPDYIPAQTGEKIYEIALQSLIKCYDAAHVAILYENTTYATAKALMDHVLDKGNPHGTDKEKVGLGHVDDTADMDKPVSVAQQAAIDAAKKLLSDALKSHIEDIGNPHGTDKEQVGLGHVDDTSDMDKPVSSAQQAALDALYQQLTAYTNQKIAGLINGAPESLDTLKEVANAIAAHKTIMDALDAAIGKKASAAEFDSHTKDTTKHITAAERTSWNDANTKKHAHGNKSILDGITSALISGWSAKMEKTGDSANNTSTFTSGDAASPTGWADIGVVASGEKHSSLWRKFSLAVKNIRYLYNLLTSGALSTLLGTNLTANRAVVANGNGKLAAVGVTATELGYLAGVKSKVQDQLNELNTGIENMSDSLGGHKVGFTTQCYTASTTMTTLLKNLTAPIMCLLSTENVSDKPTGKYGTIVIFKYSASRAGAICLCTDGTMFVNNWNASTSAVTGWMEK